MKYFSIKDELDSIDEGLIDRTLTGGTVVVWYHFDPEGTVADDVYDWGDPRDWKAPFEVPVIVALHGEGADQSPSGLGLYTTDDLLIVVAFDALYRRGMGDITEGGGHEKYLRDRFVYSGTVFSPSNIRVRGGNIGRDTIIGIDASEVDADEMVNDPDFAEYT